MRTILATLGCAILAGTLGCGPKRLVHDDIERSATIPEARCRGAEWTDESSIAAIPIPVVAFLSPQVDLHEVVPEDYLRRCGTPPTLVNREVSVDRSACIPAALGSRILTLGIYQWCPAHVAWSADVTAVGPAS
jgi:hypothetical protein